MLSSFDLGLSGAQIGALEPLFFIKAMNCGVNPIFIVVHCL